MTAIRTPMRPITTGHTAIPGTPTIMDITGPIRSFHLSASHTGTTGTMRRHPLHILEKDGIARGQPTERSMTSPLQRGEGSILFENSTAWGTQSGCPLLRFLPAESDPTMGYHWRSHQLANGIKHYIEPGIIFLLQLVK